MSLEAWLWEKTATIMDLQFDHVEGYLQGSKGDILLAMWVDVLQSECYKRVLRMWWYIVYKLLVFGQFRLDIYYRLQG